MSNIEIEVVVETSVECGECGEDLFAEVLDDGDKVSVELCETCMDKKFNEGRKYERDLMNQTKKGAEDGG